MTLDPTPLWYRCDECGSQWKRASSGTYVLIISSTVHCTHPDPLVPSPLLRLKRDLSVEVAGT